MVGMEAPRFHSVCMLKFVCVQPSLTLLSTDSLLLHSLSFSLSTTLSRSLIHTRTHIFSMPQDSSFTMKWENLLVPKLWLLEVDVVALWMRGLKYHFPRDQPAYVGSHCSFVGSYPRLNQEF
jgi:hypothetical protein